MSGMGGFTCLPHLWSISRCNYTTLELVEWVSSRILSHLKNPDKDGLVQLFTRNTRKLEVVVTGRKDVNAGIPMRTLDCILGWLAVKLLHLLLAICSLATYYWISVLWTSEHGQTWLVPVTSFFSSEISASEFGLNMEQATAVRTHFFSPICFMNLTKSHRRSWRAGTCWRKANIIRRGNADGVFWVARSWFTSKTKSWIGGHWGSFLWNRLT